MMADKPQCVRPSPSGCHNDDSIGERCWRECDLAVGPAPDYTIQPTIGRLYRHRNDRVYRLLAVAQHTETDSESLLAIYEDTEGAGMQWARPFSMFCDGRFQEVDGE